MGQLGLVLTKYIQVFKGPVASISSTRHPVNETTSWGRLVGWNSHYLPGFEGYILKRWVVWEWNFWLPSTVRWGVFFEISEIWMFFLFVQKVCLCLHGEMFSLKRGWLSQQEQKNVQNQCGFLQAKWHHPYCNMWHSTKSSDVFLALLWRARTCIYIYIPSYLIHIPYH